jgi:hypothetical protein
VVVAVVVADAAAADAPVATPPTDVIMRAPRAITNATEAALMIG